MLKRPGVSWCRCLLRTCCYSDMSEYGLMVGKVAVGGACTELCVSETRWKTGGEGLWNTEGAMQSAVGCGSARGSCTGVCLSTVSLQRVRKHKCLCPFVALQMQGVARREIACEAKITRSAYIPRYFSPMLTLHKRIRPSAAVSCCVRGPKVASNKVTIARSTENITIRSKQNSLKQAMQLVTGQCQRL